MPHVAKSHHQFMAQLELWQHKWKVYARTVDGLRRIRTSVFIALTIYPSSDKNLLLFLQSNVITLAKMKMNSQLNKAQMEACPKITQET